MLARQGEYSLHDSECLAFQSGRDANIFRDSNYESGGQEFESLRARHYKSLKSLEFFAINRLRYRLSFENSAGFSAGFGRTDVPSRLVAAWRMSDRGEAKPVPASPKSGCVGNACGTN